MSLSNGNLALGTATVDLGAIAHNFRILSRIAGVGVIAVIKADGYGHGALPVARKLVDAGAIGLGVANVGEAVELRKGGITAPITAWLHTPDTDFKSAIDADVDIALSSLRQLDAVVAAASRCGGPASVTVKVDTGMNRGGVSSQEWPAFIEAFGKAHAAGAIQLHGAMAHLSCGDEPDNPKNNEQAAGLRAAIDDLNRIGAQPNIVHLANTSATLTRPDLAFDAVRPGIGLYGLNPIPSRSAVDLIPAMALRTKVSLVKHVSAGGGISYGRRYLPPVDTVVAVIPVGYADGVSRMLSGRLRVRINGRDFPGVGLICMDQFVVDLGLDGGGVSEGDEVTLFGNGSDGEPTVQEWAHITGTIDYEIVTGIGPRIARVYIGVGPDG